MPLGVLSQRAMRELVDSGRYDTHDNFTVVLQPFFREVFLPTLPVGAVAVIYAAQMLFRLLIPRCFCYQDGKPDRSYFSPDCFHLSQKAHTLMARALWNNMVGFDLIAFDVILFSIAVVSRS